MSNLNRRLGKDIGTDTTSYALTVIPRAMDVAGQVENSISRSMGTESNV